MIAVTELDKTAGLVYMFMAKHCGRNNALMVSVDLMASRLNKSRRSIHRAIKTLREHDCITVGRVGQMNVYLLHRAHVWKHFEDAKPLTVTEARVILDDGQEGLIAKTKTLDGSMIELRDTIEAAA